MPVDFVSDFEEVTGKPAVVTKVIASPVVELVAPKTEAQVK